MLTPIHLMFCPAPRRVSLDLLLATAGHCQTDPRTKRIPPQPSQRSFLRAFLVALFPALLSQGVPRGIVPLSTKAAAAAAAFQCVVSQRAPLVLGSRGSLQCLVPTTFAHSLHASPFLSRTPSLLARSNHRANLVEHRLNDLLLADEERGVINICRAPAYVGCVSNFSNFLDLFRKTLRNVELGVPAVVLSRANTTQHMFRWAELLVELFDKHGIDQGMMTYAAFTIDDTQQAFKACPDGAMYITCSREVAANVRGSHGNVMSSTGGKVTASSTADHHPHPSHARVLLPLTFEPLHHASRCRIFNTCRTFSLDLLRLFAGLRLATLSLLAPRDAGPNTLCAPAMTDEIREAIQLSAMIENSGQCTALRHACVGGGATEADLHAMFDSAPTVSTPADALRQGSFAGVFDGKDGSNPAPFHAADGYTVHGTFSNIAFKADEALPADGLEEHWRQTYVDLTCPTDFGEPEQVSKLAAWLVRNQPISLAMNTVGGDYAYARQLFEETSQVVYTVGYEGNPALTCQARPQEGEIFGEFPVRRDLGVYTK